LVSRSLSIAWKIILVADLGVLVYGLMLVLDPYILGNGFQSYTGQSLAALSQGSPRTADYLLLIVRDLGGFNVAFATVTIGVVLTGFRRREPWAWYLLLAGNIVGYGGSILFDLTVRAIGVFEILEFGFAGLIFASLAVSAREILRLRKTRRQESLPVEGGTIPR